MSAKSVLELMIKQTSEGNGISKVTAEISWAKDGLTGFEKAAAGTRSTIKGLDKDISVMGKNVGSAADALSGMGISIPISPMQLFGQALKAGVEFVQESIAEYRELERTMLKFDKVFAGSAAGMKVSLAGMGDAIGMSTGELTKMAASVQDTFVPLGFARDKAAELSQGLVGLATDVGAFNNVSSSESMQAFLAALVGNTEGVRKYGIVINEATTNQELMRMGISGGTAAATQQELVMARLNQLYAGSADAIGAAADAMETGSGKANAFTAAMQDYMAAIGENFSNIDTSGVTNALNKSLAMNTAVQRLREAYEDGTISLGEFTSMNWKAGWSMEGVTEVMGELDAAYAEQAQAAADAEVPNLAYISALSEVPDAAAYAIEQEEKLAEATKLAAEEAAAANEQMGLLNAVINGQLGPSAEQFTEKQDALAESMVGVQTEIDALNAKTYLTTAEKDKLTELQGKYDEMTQTYADNAEAHEEASRRILFGILQQQAAADGLTQAEVAALTSVASEWGLVDEATATAMGAASEFFSQLTGDGALTTEQIQALEAALNGINGKKYSATVEVTTVGSTPVYTGGGGASATRPNRPNASAQTYADGGEIAPYEGGIVGEEGVEWTRAGTQGMTVVPLGGGGDGGGGGAAVTVNLYAPVYTFDVAQIESVVEEIMLRRGR